MHRLVNGKRVELSPEEEVEVLEQRAIDDAKREQRRALLQKEADRRTQILDGIKAKLSLTDEEMNTLMGK